MALNETPNTKHQTPNSLLALEVRPWLVLTGMLLIVVVAMSAYRLKSYLHERDVLMHGPLVQATVVQVGLSLAHEGMRDEALRVSLVYTTPQGQNLPETWGELPRKPGALISAREVIPVHIDPADPTYWTARETEPPLGAVLAVPLICLPAALLCAAIAWLRWRTVHALSIDGQRRAAKVINVKLAPLAPLSKQIGITLENEPVRRVLHCYWPSQRGKLVAGDMIEVMSDGRHAMVTAKI